MNDMSDIFEDELDEGCEFCGKKDCIGSAGTCDGLMESNNGEPLSKKDVICDCKLHYDYCPMPNNCPHNPKWVEVGRIKEIVEQLEMDMINQPLKQQTIETCMKYIHKWFGGLSE